MRLQRSGIELAWGNCGGKRQLAYLLQQGNIRRRHGGGILSLDDLV